MEYFHCNWEDHEITSLGQHDSQKSARDYADSKLGWGGNGKTLSEVELEAIFTTLMLAIVRRAIGIDK